MGPRITTCQPQPQQAPHPVLAPVQHDLQPRHGAGRRRLSEAQRALQPRVRHAGRAAPSIPPNGRTAPALDPAARAHQLAHLGLALVPTDVGIAAPANDQRQHGGRQRQPASVASSGCAARRRCCCAVCFARRPSAWAGHQHGRQPHHDPQRPPTHAKGQKLHTAPDANANAQGSSPSHKARPAAPSGRHGPGAHQHRLQPAHMARHQARGKGWFWRRMDITSHPNIATPDRGHDRRDLSWPCGTMITKPTVASSANASTNFQLWPSWRKG